MNDIKSSNEKLKSANEQVKLNINEKEKLKTKMKEM